MGAALWPRMVLALLLIAAASPAHAQVYRWVDAEGRVHYTDKPPPGQRVDETGIRSEPTDLEATLRDQVERERRLELAGELRADAAEDAAAAAEYRERLARSCGQARDRVATIERARRLSRDGQTYSDAERAAALAEARRQVQEWCR